MGVADGALATISAHVPLVLLQVHAWRRWPEGKSSPPSVALLLLHLDEAVSCCDLHFCPPPRRLGPHISSSALRPVLCGSQSRVLPQGSPFCTKESFSSSTNPVPCSAQLPACHTPDVCVACPRGPSAGEQVQRSGAESWSHSLTTGRVVSISVFRGGWGSGEGNGNLIKSYKFPWVYPRGQKNFLTSGGTAVFKHDL